MVSATAQTKSELAADLTRVKSALRKLVRAADKARDVLVLEIRPLPAPPEDAK